MKKLIFVLVLLTSTVIAADLSGRWSGRFKVNGGDHDVPQLLILKQSGSKLTGSGGPDDSEQYPLENGTIAGDQAKFQITTGEWKFSYNLKIAASSMSGELELTSVNDRRTAKVTLTKQSE